MHLNENRERFLWTAARFTVSDLMSAICQHWTAFGPTNGPPAGKEILRALWIMDVAFWRQYHYTEHNMDSSGHGCWLVKTGFILQSSAKVLLAFSAALVLGYFSHDFFPIWILKSLWLIVISPKLSQLATRWITKLALENLRQKDKSYKALIRKITTIPRSIANDNRIKNGRELLPL